jgi:hypothetical protein
MVYSIYHVVYILGDMVCTMKNLKWHYLTGINHGALEPSRIQMTVTVFIVGAAGARAVASVTVTVRGTVYAVTGLVNWLDGSAACSPFK